MEIKSQFEASSERYGRLVEYVFERLDPLTNRENLDDMDEKQLVAIFTAVTDKMLKVYGLDGAPPSLSSRPTGSIEDFWEVLLHPRKSHKIEE